MVHIQQIHGEYTNKGLFRRHSPINYDHGKTEGVHLREVSLTCSLGNVLDQEPFIQRYLMIARERQGEEEAVTRYLCSDE